MKYKRWSLNVKQKIVSKVPKKLSRTSWTYDVASSTSSLKLNEQIVRSRNQRVCCPNPHRIFFCLLLLSRTRLGSLYLHMLFGCRSKFCSPGRIFVLNLLTKTPHRRMITPHLDTWSNFLDRCHLEVKAMVHNQQL